MTENGSSVDTTRPTVTVPPPPNWSTEPVQGDGRQPRRRRFEWLGWSLLGLVALVAGLATLIRLPYYRIAPGSVYDTVERIDVQGDREFAPEGDIGFVTVSQTPDISIWQWLDAKLDDDVELKHEDEINGDQTGDEKRAQDQRRMQVSKDAAVVVALERLGYELTVTPLGVEVASVFACSAADGILGTGDLIVGLDGVDVRETEDLLAQLVDREIGDEIELLVERIDPANSAMTLRTELVSITLGSADQDCLPEDVRAGGARPFIGIGTNTIVDEQLPFDVEIDTGRVGGPSAGLAFTLAIMDVLSEGELTSGLNIVATGTIDREGTVGAVGGIPQKTVAAERAGADVFIVPLCCDNWVDRETGEPLDQPSNYEEALLHAEDMEVIGVANLDEALAALGSLGGDVESFFESGSNEAAVEAPATAQEDEDSDPESEGPEVNEADVDTDAEPRRGERKPG